MLSHIVVVEDVLNGFQSLKLKRLFLLLFIRCIIQQETNISYPNGFVFGRQENVVYVIV